jgi:hypothetical protein
MAKLENILGAILSDITKAQVISDAYSRDLKPSYREDPFLKLFPVPRIEIKDVTIDLKFTIPTLEKEKLPEIKVVFYKEANYQGSPWQINGDIDGASSQVSSLQLAEGIKVTLYEKPGFTGRSLSFTEAMPWVAWPGGGTVIPASIRVERTVNVARESMEIEVATDRLANLSEAAISSMEIKLDLTSA